MKQVEEAYSPSQQELEYGRTIKTPSASVRPQMPVYHNGCVRHVYTDTWTLVPTYGSTTLQYWGGFKKRRSKSAYPKNPQPQAVRSTRLGGCERCGDHRPLTRHHVVHRSKGGGGGENLQLLCWPCHAHAHNVLKVPSGVRVPRLETVQVAQW